MAAISQTTFSDLFSWIKFFVYLIQISLKFVPKSLMDSIGLDNELTLNWWQAIIWTNADPIPWRIFAIGGDELNFRAWTQNICKNNNNKKHGL